MTDYPIPDPLPNRPPVLLGEGERPDAFDAPRVAIVGTRSATPHGLADARELGAFLADAGVTVVSGLAIGIDGAAHEGALDAGGLAIGVVATGLDVTYPRRHRVALRPGARARPGRRRARLRRAALPRALPGPQPHHRRARRRSSWWSRPRPPGGARITAGYAADYGRDVFALPGSRRNPAAAGCNALIADGAEPLLDPGDLLIALGRGGSRPGRWSSDGADGPSDRDEAAVLHALGGDPATIDELERNTRARAGPARWRR